MRLLVIAAGLLCLTRAEPAFACCCGAGPCPSIYREWFKKFDGVLFRGTIIDTVDAERFREKITFRAERYWKGVTSRKVVLCSMGSSNTIAFSGSTAQAATS